MDKRTIKFVLYCVLLILFPCSQAKTNPSEHFTEFQSFTEKASVSYVPNELIIKYAVPDSINKSIATSSEVSESASESASSILNKYGVRSVKKVLPSKAVSTKQQLTAIDPNEGASLTQQTQGVDPTLKYGLDRLHLVTFQPDGGYSLEKVLIELNEHPDIEYAEYNYQYFIDLVPNDPNFSAQWALNNIGQTYPYSGRYNVPPGVPDADIDAPEAWDYMTGGDDIVVAVIDTGIDYRHRDLVENLWMNEDEAAGLAGIDDDGNGYVDDIYGYDFWNNDGDPNDDHGHGTHCSGIIAAQGNNGLDIAGVCWDAKVMGLKFLTSQGSGDLASALEAVYYAVENGAHILSNSWGGAAYSQALEEAFAYAHERGCIVVASAGNKNSTDAYYPSNYDHVISVAALDSNDERAPFSNYGELVELAAPGVDILSLLAAGQELGTINNPYTTVASGTSMACPIVAGASALLLTINPYMPESIIYELLFDTGDPIADGICQSDKRVNLSNAIKRINGELWFDRDVYSCDSEITISLLDLNLLGQLTQEVFVETGGGDFERLLLDAYTSEGMLLKGTIHSDSGTVIENDGRLQLSHGDIISVIYYAEQPIAGGGTELTDTAIADCAPPEIIDIHARVLGSVVSIDYMTDEPASSSVSIGTSCLPESLLESNINIFQESHIHHIEGLLPSTTYYYVVEVADQFGNSATYQNAGQCYTFTTLKPLGEIHVPEQFPTIQAAIDHAWDGDHIFLADYVYTGDGNRDLDFLGKAVSLRSQHGPDHCVIDPNGTTLEPHRAIHFYRNETEDTVVEGITFTGGYAEMGGVIFCQGASPTIRNCVFRDTHLDFEASGGVFYNQESHPIIQDCLFEYNTAGIGGAITNEISNPTIERCTFLGNHALYEDYDFGGGAILNFESDPNILDCDFTENTAAWDGGAILNTYNSSPMIYDCRFRRNRSIENDGGAIFNIYASNPNIIRCLITGNRAGSWGGGMRNTVSSPIITNSEFTGNFAVDDGGAIFNYFLSNSFIRNCTFHGNSVNGNLGESILSWLSMPEISNSIFWDIDNTLDFGKYAITTIDHSIVEGGWEGPGNLDADPKFVREGRWLNVHAPGTEPDPNDPNTIWVEGDYRLLSESPAINAADPNYPPSSDEKDLDGRPRIIGSGLDMGAYEYNHLPVAEAGPNQTVFLDFYETTASIFLDGSASYDPEGSPLTYLWSWMVGDQNFNTSGIEPTIEMPPGSYTVQLRVDDGADASLPDTMEVHVVGPIVGELYTLPWRLFQKGGGNRLYAFLYLPEVTNPNDIKQDSFALYPGGTKPERIHFLPLRSGMLGFFVFSKNEVLTGFSEYGLQDITLAGKMKSEQSVYGSGKLKIEHKRKRKRGFGH